MSLVLRRRVSAPEPGESSAWKAARDQFCLDLDEDEKKFFLTSSPNKPQDLVKNVVMAEIEYSATSSLRCRSRRLRNLIEGFDQFKYVVDAFAEVYPQALYPVWGCVRVVLQMALSYERYFDKLVDMFESLSRELARLRDCERIYHTQRFSLALQEAYVGIIQFCVEVKNTFWRAKQLGGSRMFLRIYWITLNGSFENRLQRLRHLLANVKEETNAAHRMELSDMRHDTAWRDQEKLTQFLLHGNCHQNLQAVLSQTRHPRSCEWLPTLSTFEKWNESSSGCFWLYGPVGSGKTILSSFVVDHLKSSRGSHNERLVHYHCDYLSEETLKGTTFFESIIGQIVELGISRELQELVSLQYRGGNFPGFHIPTANSLELLVKILRSTPPSTVVIDGIDECEELDRSYILSAIRTIFDTDGLSVKFFISSRDMPDIRQSLGNGMTLELTKEHVDRDMYSYISDRIDDYLRDPSREGLAERNPELIERIVSKLLECADGMFLLVSMQLALIFAAATEHEIELILDDLPRGLVEAYTRILRKIAKSCGTKESVDRVRRTFQWVYASQRPLTLDELAEAAAFTPSDEDWDAAKLPMNPSRIIDDCKNLILLPKGGRARFTHSTVQDFLVGQPADDSVAAFHFSPNDARQFMAEMCVAYLCFGEFEMMLKRWERKTSLAKAPVPTRVFVDSALSSASRSKSVSMAVRPVKALTSGNPLSGFDFGRATKTLRGPDAESTTAVVPIKHSFLGYVSKHWLEHCKHLGNDRALAWKRFALLVFEKQLNFDFKPWDDTPPAPDLAGLPMLDWALREGHLPLLKLLSAHGQRPFWEEAYDLRKCCEYEFRFGKPPLISALTHQCAELVSLLLEHAAPEMLNWELLFEAVKVGGETLNVILGSKIDVSLVNHRGMTALHLAAKLGSMDATEQLLSHGADCNKRDEYSQTPLHTAILERNQEVALTILQMDVEVNTKDHLGHSPLMDACEKVLVDVIQALLIRGADRNVISDAGRPIIHLAVSQSNLEVVEMLLLAGDIDINARDMNQASALQEAAEVGHYGISALLLDHGIDEGIFNADGELAVHWASGNGSVPVCKLLLERGSKRYINAAGPTFQNTPLQWAVRRKRHGNARLLLEHGADIHVNLSGRTALHYASENGDGDMVKLLLEYGASITEKDRDFGKTAAQIATEYGHDDVARILKDHGGPSVKEEVPS